VFFFFFFHFQKVYYSVYKGARRKRNQMITIKTCDKQ